MSAILAAAWSRAAGWIAAIGTALAVLAAFYGAGRRDGRALTESRIQQRAARARELRDAVDRDVDRTGDPADELRRDWRRD
jgi:plasmid stabilization system protein ParE